MLQTVDAKTEYPYYDNVNSKVRLNGDTQSERSAILNDTDTNRKLMGQHIIGTHYHMAVYLLHIISTARGSHRPIRYLNTHLVVQIQLTFTTDTYGVYWEVVL